LDDGTNSNRRCFETTSWGAVNIYASKPQTAGPPELCLHEGQNIFSITSAELNEWDARNQGLSISIASASMAPHIIVINVMDVSDTRMTGGFTLSGEATHGNVLLNFCPARRAAGAAMAKFNIGKYAGYGNCNGGMGIEGSILAPSVDVSGCGQLHGQLWANSFTGPMAFHHGALIGAGALCRP